MIAYHMSWPAGNDPFYQNNVAENNARKNYYGVNYVPHVYIDGMIDGGSSGPWEDMMLDRHAQDSPLTIAVTGEMLGDYNGTITAHITNVGDATVSGNLHFVLIESDIDYLGEAWNEVMRDFFPNVTGQPISLAPTEELIQEEPFTLPSPPNDYVTENLQVIVFVQNNGTKEIYQTSRLFFLPDEPELVLDDWYFDDSTGGNGNGYLEQGETAEVVFGLGNLNPATGTSIAGTLTSLGPEISVVDAAGSWPDIASMTTGYNDADPFEVTAVEEAPWGTEVQMELTVTAEGRLFVGTMEVTIPIGAPDNPIGPDGYGYYAYEDVDPYVPSPEYEWFEIDPNLGGPGTLISLNDNTTIRNDLPFTFQYYGSEYTRVSICSNGWIALGSTYYVTKDPYELPSIYAPPNLVAGMMTNLDPSAEGSGQVYDYHDTATGRYIVEFSGVEHKDDDDLGAPETFQFILYDPAMYETPTGDGEITVQYALVSDDSGCTAGIQNEDRDIATQYLADGHLNAAATGLAAGRAIKYSTADPTPAAAVDDGVVAVAQSAMLMARPNPTRGGTTISFHVPQAGDVALKVYNLEGGVVRTLLQGSVPAGPGSVQWDGRDNRGFDVPAGVYFYRLSGAGFEVNRKGIMQR
jgi:hypothetical protein